jgi:Pyruvate/2-oxoacid:ferredoxin oxidoreductase delta subunit
MKKREKDWTREELTKWVMEHTALTIPVNVTFSEQQRVLDLSSAEKIIEEAKSIGVQKCVCRNKLHKCNAPIDVCLALNFDDKTTERGTKRISRSQALEIMRRTNEAGLVHMTITTIGKKKPSAICSCCSCCCHSLSAMIRFGIPDSHVVSSEYVASNNPETCSNCGTCVKRCQFHARRSLDGKMQFDQAKCFGCGLCVSTCPTDSITLVNRE